MESEQTRGNAKRPYRSAVRDERAIDTRRRIASAAHDLFTEHGFTGTTVARIAERAGVATPTVYAIFGSKAAIVASLLEQMENNADSALWVQRIAQARTPTRGWQLSLNGAPHCFPPAKQSSKPPTVRQQIPRSTSCAKRATGIAATACAH